MTEAPGPGYYNYHSDFDMPESAGGNSYADTNFLMQLNAARKRQSAVFESRTGRDAMMQEIKRKDGPGKRMIVMQLLVLETYPPCLHVYLMV